MTSDLQGIDPARRSGVALDAITAAKRQYQRAHRRPPALTAREALHAMQFECLVLWVLMKNIRAGVALSEEDHERANVAMSRVNALTEEVSNAERH